MIVNVRLPVNSGQYVMKGIMVKSSSILGSADCAHFLLNATSLQPKFEFLIFPRFSF